MDVVCGELSVIVFKLITHMSNKVSQKDELCVLESIYSEDEIQTYELNGLFGGQIYAHVNLPAGFKIIFSDLRKKVKGCFTIT